MSGNDHKSSPLSQAPAALKRVPGVVAAVRKVRALRRKTLVETLSRILKWASRTPERRMLVFDALPKKLALAHHERESYIVHTSDEVVGRSLYRRGQFDFQKFEAAYHLLRLHGRFLPGEALPVLIDVGANVGSICIPAVKREYVQRSIAIEPDYENFQLLKANAALNGVDGRIDPRQVAVGARRGQVSLRRNQSNFGDHRVLTVPVEGTLTLPMVTVDEIAGELDLQRTILWMDIQGFEGYALQGAQRFLDAGVPLICEFSPEELKSSGCFDIFLSMIASSAYEIFYDLNALKPDRYAASLSDLQSLAAHLESNGNFTDILLLPDTMK